MVEPTSKAEASIATWTEDRLRGALTRPWTNVGSSPNKKTHRTKKNQPGTGMGKPGPIPVAKRQEGTTEEPEGPRYDTPQMLAA